MSVQAGSRWDDEKIENLVGNLLRAGVLSAAVIVLIGAAVFLARNGFSTPDYKVFHGEASELRSVPGIVAEARAFRGRGIIQLGLLVLIATPIARVAFSAIAFALQKDRLYVFITCLVLAILVFSLSGHAP
jgi:uncharacterized membrane protein